MKRNGGILTLLSIFLSSIVSAGPVEGLEQLARGTNEMIIIIIQFISNIIFDLESFDEFLFAKLLIFTLILLVVYTVIKQNSMLGNNKAIQWIIASAISILAVRYLPNNFVQAILLQYGSLAVGLTVFLPLTIYFFFIHQSGLGPFGRKAGWIVFATSFFAMWSFRYDDLGNANWIYWIGIGFILLSLIFDRSIHRYFGMSGIKRVLKKKKSDQHRHWKRELHLLEDDYVKEIVTEAQYKREKPIIEKRIRDTAP